MEFDFKNEFESMMKSNELDTVVVLGHINPDGDAAGSVMGIAHYIGVNYPEYQVFPYLADTIDKGPKLQVHQDKKFDPFEKPDLQGKRFATVICDTATLARLSGREFYEASVASIVIDHHASNEGYGDRNYTKVSEACAVNVFYSLNQDDLKKAAEAEEKGTGGWSELPSGLILQGYLKEKIQTAGGNKVSNIQCGASRVSEDGEWIDLRASYQVRLPFSVFALDHVTLTSRSRKRGWIGAEGGYFSEKNASEPEEKWVYVGRDSTRYHLSPSCHYISNQITAAAYADVISGVLRNSGGCRYKACRYCGKTVSAGGLVYILPSGEVYHGKQDCSSLAYYVQKVRRSEVEYMGVCSYCGSG